MEVIDLGALQPDLSYEEGIRLCVKLKLVETMQHGDQEYIRMTQKGTNVISALMTLMSDCCDPENILRPS
jgi:hypothetical protein